MPVHARPVGKDADGTRGDSMEEAEAPPAQRGHAPPGSVWIKPQIERTLVSARLVQWTDEQGSIVRLLTTNTLEDATKASHTD
ncbi:MAG: hypothetical protein JWN41_1530 [Thermoleophilia bacterium]|nr:hypothetical protein [Thermoleophilia bacterium]